MGSVNKRLQRNGYVPGGSNASKLSARMIGAGVGVVAPSAVGTCVYPGTGRGNRRKKK
jgi:hypothetical protein